MSEIKKNFDNQEVSNDGVTLVTIEENCNDNKIVWLNQEIMGEESEKENYVMWKFI